MKKMLLMGGSNCAEEIRRFACKHNVYLIAVGNVQDSQLKQIADKSYMIDAIDLEALDALVKSEGIDAVFPGFNETLVPVAIQLARQNNLPTYCTLEQWELCVDKEKFKKLCIANNVLVARTYSIEDAESLPYPVVTKPADSCGSQGFSICHNPKELAEGYTRALSFSAKGKVIIEDYMEYDSVIIHYTAVNGSLFFSGMSDKKSGALCNNSSVMALQCFPSVNEADYCDELNERVIKMYQSIGIKNGPIWIEAFNNNGEFFFNEMGYRFGGSMTFYPVEYYTGVSQLDLLLENAIFGHSLSENKLNYDNQKKHYAIFPLHLHSGKIAEIEGIEDVLSEDYLFQYVPVRFKGDNVVENGTVSQVFAYFHVLFQDKTELDHIIEKVLGSLSVKSEKGDDMLFCVLRERLV